MKSFFSLVGVACLLATAWLGGCQALSSSLVLVLSSLFAYDFTIAPRLPVSDFSRRQDDKPS